MSSSLPFLSMLFFALVANDSIADVCSATLYDSGERCYCNVNGENISGNHLQPSWALSNGFTGTAEECQALCDATNACVSYHDSIADVCSATLYDSGERCYCNVNGENISGNHLQPSWALSNGFTGTAEECQALCDATNACVSYHAPACRVRRSWSTMDDDEKEHYINVYKQVSETQKFKDFTAMHGQQFSDIHSGPQFLPWHRYFLFTIENWMREIDSDITLPFWAWEEDSGESWLWTSDNPIWGPEPHAFGSRSGIVEDGPFACEVWQTGDGNCLERGSMPGHPSDEVDVQDTTSGNDLSHDEFSNQINWFHHGTMHGLIGGTMRSTSTSAYAPLFILHHNNVDRFWFMWQNNGNAHIEPTHTGPMTGQLLGESYVAMDFNDPSNQPGGVCIEYQDTGAQSARRLLGDKIDPKRFVIDMVHRFPKNHKFHEELQHLHELDLNSALEFHAEILMSVAQQEGRVLHEEEAMEKAREKFHTQIAQQGVRRVALNYQPPSPVAEFFSRKSGVTMESVRAALLKYGFKVRAARFESDIRILAAAIKKATKTSSDSLMKARKN